MAAPFVDRLSEAMTSGRVQRAQIIRVWRGCVRVLGVASKGPVCCASCCRNDIELWTLGQDVS